jgi:hypothetical protein
MPGVRARIMWVGLAVAGIGGALDGCGGSLGGGPTGTGGQPDPAGTTGAAGRGGRGGIGSGGRSGPFGEPRCAGTVGKGAPCGPADQQVCYKACGPSSSGVKAEMCIGGVYNEMSGCSFDPARDYSCYRIPTVANTDCLPSGEMVPMAGAPCSAAPCTLCNTSLGLPGGTYVDVGGAPKIGYCVCDRSGPNMELTWTCASDTSWPCPVGAGCGTTTGTGGTSGGSFGEPACPSTVVRNQACLPDIPFCYKSCGPEGVGAKTETCNTSLGTYAEMSGCSFDPYRDYSCYKLPAIANAVCPAGVTPQSSQPCDVPYCTLCNSLQGLVGGQYSDPGGANKLGWCVCKQPDATGTRAWSCASDVFWPCPLGSGC